MVMNSDINKVEIVTFMSIKDWEGRMKDWWKQKGGGGAL
jgi:hypothetical protein